MAKQEGVGFGVKPPILIIENQVIATENLLHAYRSNGYDLQAISERAYCLAQERQRLGDPRGWNNDQNWRDAELEIAIKSFKKDSPQPQ
jgi:hypothetical protein